MRFILLIMICCLVLSDSFGQSDKSISGYLQADYNHTLYDQTKGNNPSGAGLGILVLYNKNKRIKPAVELSAAFYPGDDKVLRLDPNGEHYEEVPFMINLFAGAMIQPGRRIYISFLGGPSFIGGQTFAGIKPSLGFYFSENQRWSGKVSFINIFNRTSTPRRDFGSISFSLGLRIF